MNKTAPLLSLPLVLALLVAGCGELATEPEPRTSVNALKGEPSAPPSLRGQEFTLVGYGTDLIDRASEERLVKGFRQVASAPFQALTPESLVLQATPEATGEGFVCAGDSGGPQFLAETNLAVSLVGGITNSGSPCGTGARFMQRLDTPVMREFLADFIDLP